MATTPLDPHAGVIFRLSWRGTWARLSDAEVGILTRSLLAHAAGEAVDADALPGRYLPGMYEAHATEIDLDLAAYAEKIQRRREAGRKGGRPRKDAMPEAEPEAEAPEATPEAEETPEPEKPEPVPAPVPVKAKPSKPSGMSEAEQRRLFDVFWTVAGDASQSPAGAWSWWRKAVHSEARAEELTIAAERAQALQDARGLARYNVIGWLRKQGWKAEVCANEAAFRAELARVPSGRRAAAPAGSTENALAALLGGAEPEPVDVQAIEEGRHD